MSLKNVYVCSTISPSSNRQSLVAFSEPAQAEQAFVLSYAKVGKPVFGPDVNGLRDVHVNGVLEGYIYTLPLLDQADHL